MQGISQGTDTRAAVGVRRSPVNGAVVRSGLRSESVSRSLQAVGRGFCPEDGFPPVDKERRKITFVPAHTPLLFLRHSSTLRLHDYEFDDTTWKL